MIGAKEWIDILQMLLAGAMGWLLKLGWDSIKDLQTDHKDHTDRTQHLEILIAGDYVKKADMRIEMQAINDKLDRIEKNERGRTEQFVTKTDYVESQKRFESKLDKIFDKLDGKADKTTKGL